MKRKNFSFIDVLLFLMISLMISGCQETSYDTLDFSSPKASVTMDTPLNFTVQNSANYISMWWYYPLNQSITVSFSIYRSTSIDGEFELRGKEISSTSYIDSQVVPGKIYYYKVQANSVLYGNSAFSDVKMGCRYGRGRDMYEDNNEKSRSMPIELDTIYKASLYDDNTSDIDWYSVNASEGDILQISVNAPSDSNALLSCFDITVESDTKVVLSKTTQTLGSTYTIFFSRDTTLYIGIITDATATSLRRNGDYDLQITSVDSSLLYSASAESSSSSYIKVSWSSYLSGIATLYRVQRRLAGSSGEWTLIKGALSAYRLDTHDEFANSVLAMYDRSAECGISYEYRVAGVLKVKRDVDGVETETEVVFYSSTAQGKRLNPPEDNHDENTDFDHAQEITIDTTLQGAIPADQKSKYYRVTLAAGEKYTVAVTPLSSNGKLLFSLAFYSPQQESQVYIAPNESSFTYGTFTYTPETDGIYWLRVDGNNTTGAYSVLISGDDT